MRARMMEKILAIFTALAIAILMVVILTMAAMAILKADTGILMVGTTADILSHTTMECLLTRTGRADKEVGKILRDRTSASTRAIRSTSSDKAAKDKVPMSRTRSSARDRATMAALPTTTTFRAASADNRILSLGKGLLSRSGSNLLRGK